MMIFCRLVATASRTIGLVAVATMLSTAAPAAAAPRRPVPGVNQAAAAEQCQVQPAARVTEAPWTMSRYPPERLNRLADGGGVTVAVIDSGVDARHLQLAGAVVPGRDFLEPGGDGTTDCVGHGTAVASIIAARAVEGVNFRGVAPGARILPVRVAEDVIIDGRTVGHKGTAADFADAIRWSVAQGARVINVSAAIYDQDVPAVKAAIDDAVAHDVVVVAAVGNMHTKGNPRPYPAAYDGVLGVGAIGPAGLRESYSQVGPYVDLMAPGGGVLGAAPIEGHTARDGTSLAAPFVSATAALVRQSYPGLSAPQVIQRLIATADPAPGGRRSDAYGNGVLNPYRALTETLSPGQPVAAAPLPVRKPDPVAAAREQRRAAAQRHAFWFAGLATLAGLTVVVAAVVLPRGTRRRWRPAGPA